MVLDCVADGDNPLVIWKWHQGSNQRWNIFRDGNNKYIIINLMNSKVISSPINSQKEGV